MILTVPLQPGTTLSNVRYRWIALGAIGSEQSSGITQPWATVPEFRIDSTPPADAEELIVYDSIDTTNWNVGGYAVAKSRDTLAGAAQILLASLFVPTAPGGFTIAPASSSTLSICRCFGNFKNLSNLSADGIDVTFNLIQVDATDPTLIYDTSGILVRDRSTRQIISGRVTKAKITAGQLKDLAGNAWLDLVRTDYMNDSAGVALPRMKYSMECAELGAKGGLSLLFSGGPQVFAPVLFKLDSTTLGQGAGGTFDISKATPSTS